MQNECVRSDLYICTPLSTQVFFFLFLSKNLDWKYQRATQQYLHSKIIDFRNIIIHHLMKHYSRSASSKQFKITPIFFSIKPLIYPLPKQSFHPENNCIYGILYASLWTLENHYVNCRFPYVVGAYFLTGNDRHWVMTWAEGLW